MLVHRLIITNNIKVPTTTVTTAKGDNLSLFPPDTMANLIILLRHVFSMILSIQLLYLKFLTKDLAGEQWYNILHGLEWVIISIAIPLFF